MKFILLVFAFLSSIVSVQAFRQSSAIRDAYEGNRSLDDALSIRSFVGLEERPRFAAVYASAYILRGENNPANIERAEALWTAAPKGPTKVATISVLLQMHTAAGRTNDAQRMISLGKKLAPTRPEWVNHLTTQP